MINLKREDKIIKTKVQHKKQVSKKSHLAVETFSPFFKDLSGRGLNKGTTDTQSKKCLSNYIW